MMKRFIAIAIVFLCCTAMFAKGQKEPDSDLYRRGVEAIKDKKYDKGIDLLNQELANNPKNGYPSLWIAVGRGMQGNFGKVLNATTYSIKYLPKKDKKNLSKAYQIRGASHIVLGDTLDALNDFSAAIKLNPENALIYKSRAEIYFETKQYDLSCADYLQVIKIEPGSTTGFIGYGQVLMEQKDYDKAIEQFSRAIKLDRKSSDALVHRGKCYTKQHKYEEAVADFVKAMELDDNRNARYELTHIDKEGFEFAENHLKLQRAKNPKSPMWLITTALLYENNHQYRDAISYLKKAKSQNADSWLDTEISNCYYRMGDFNQALTYRKSVYETDTTSGNAMLLIADCYNEMDSVDLAIQWANIAIEQHPDMASWYYRRGWYSDKAGRWDDAIEDYTMAITINPKYSYALLCRGQLYRWQGKEERAQKDFERTIAAEPTPKQNACTQYAYFYLGDTAKATAFMDSVLAQYPDELYDAACLYSLVGDTTTSIKHLRHAFENGFRRFAHIRKDKDMKNVCATTAYQALYDEYWQIYQLELAQPEIDVAATEEVTYEIPFTTSNGVNKVDCTINGLPLNFIFDTGASIVTISQVEANFMFKNGYLTAQDILGKRRYETADGTIGVGTEVNIRHINFGGVELTDVRASVVGTQKASLLLGQSVLKRLGKIEIDNERRVLKITTNK